MKKILMLLFITSVFFLNAQNTISDNVYEKTLDNGLKIIVKEIENTLLVLSSIVYNVGIKESHEFGSVEIAHYLEHMLFRNNGNTDFDKMVNLISSSGGNIDGMTGLTFTEYDCVAPASFIEEILTIEASRMNQVVFDSDEMEIEKKIVLSELKAYGFTPLNDFYKKIYNKLSLPYYYGEDNQKSIDDTIKVSKEELTAFYQKYYMPNNATLLITGGVEHEKVFELSEKYFGNISKGKLLEESRPEIDKIKGKKYVKSSGVYSDYIGHKYYNFDEFDIDNYDRTVMSFIIQTDLISNLRLEKFENYEFLVEEYNKKSSDLIEIIDFELLEKEFIDIKNKYLNKRKLAIDHIEEIHYILLENYIKYGDYSYFDKLLTLYENIEFEDIKRVLYKYLKTDDYLIAEFTPTKYRNLKNIAQKQDTDSFAEDQNNPLIKEENENIDLLKKQVEFSYKKIKNEIKKIENLSQSFTLDNGLKVHYTHNPSNNNTYITTVHDAGIMDETKPFIAEITFKMLYEGGIQVNKKNELLRQGAIWKEVFIDDNKTFHNIITTTDSLNLAVETLDLTLANNNFHNIVLESIKEEIAKYTITRLKRTNNAVEHAYENLLSIVYDKNAPVYKQSNAVFNDVASITMEDINAFYSYVNKPENIEIFITTATSFDKVQNLFNEHFLNVGNNLENTEKDPDQKASLSFNDIAEETVIKKRIFQAHENIVLFLQPFNLKDKDFHREKAALDIAFSILSGHMSSRLFKNIRIKSGLSYKVETGYTDFDYKSTFLNYLYFMTDSKTLEEGISAIKNELLNFKKYGPTENEFYFNKNRLINNIAFQTNSTSDLHEYNIKNKLYGISLENQLNMLYKMTKEEIKDVFGDKIDPDKYYISIAGPLK